MSNHIVEHCQRGWWLLKKDDYQEAVKEFQKALDLEEKCLEANEGMGLSLNREIEKFSTLLDDIIKPGASPLEKLMQPVDPPKKGTITINNVSFDIERIKAIMTLQERASVHLQRAFDLGSQRVDVCEALARMPKVDLGLKHKCIDRALSLNPRSSWANFLRGMYYSNQGDYHQAAKYFAASVKENPDCGEWRNELGFVYMQLEGFQAEALNQLLEAVRLKPSYASSWFNLGTLTFNMGDRNKAMIAYKKFLEIEPFSIDAMRLKKWFPELEKS